jgi:nucleoid-associated protein EbfC
MVQSIAIDPSLMKPDEREILEDLLVAALNDAKSKAEILAAEEMKTLTGGLPLPPGMNLPF